MPNAVDVSSLPKALARFWPKVDRRGDSECWPWQGSIGTKGYGNFRLEGSAPHAHRAAYLLLVGPIPNGLTIDHLCRNRFCVNPAHLEPVSIAVNVLRGSGTAAQNRRKTVCLRGHKFDEANTRWYRGKRYCRACVRCR
jgi:hypothetical protein